MRRAQAALRQSLAEGSRGVSAGLGCHAACVAAVSDAAARSGVAGASRAATAGASNAAAAAGSAAGVRRDLTSFVGARAQHHRGEEESHARSIARVALRRPSPADRPSAKRCATFDHPLQSTGDMGRSRTCGDGAERRDGGSVAVFVRREAGPGRAERDYDT